MKQSRDGRETLYVKLKNLRIEPFNSQLSLHMKWVTKTPRKHVFTQKQFEKRQKTWVIQITSKSKQKEQKSFWFDLHMVEHTHITFEHVQPHK